MAIFRWFLSDVAGGKNEPRKASCIFVQCLFLEVLDLKTHGKLMQYSFNFASEISGTKTHLCQGLNSHYFHIIGVVINPIVGVYIPIIRIPVIKGWRFPMPNTRS